MAQPTRTISRQTASSDLDTEYKWGFVTDIEEDNASQGSERGRRPPDLAEEERAGVDAGVAPEGVPPLADAGATRAPNGRRSTTRRSTTRTSTTTPPRRKRTTARSRWTRSTRSSSRRSTSWASRLQSRRRSAGVAVDAVFDSVSVATTFQKQLEELGVIFCPISEAIQQAPGAGQEVPRLGRALHRQLLRDA